MQTRLQPIATILGKFNRIIRDLGTKLNKEIELEIIGKEGAIIGRVTSGGYGPSVGGPVAIGYLESDYAEVGTRIGLMVRGKELPARVVSMPFVPHRYYRKAKAN